MICTGFDAENFRNIRTCHVTFSPGVNLFCGKNAQGKTNAMEGIYLFSRGKSFRGASDKEMTQFGEKGFSLGVSYRDADGENDLSYTYYAGDRRRTKNGYPLTKATEFVGHFRAVLFCPDHLSLVKGGPEERRAFLNIGIAASRPSYLKEYASFAHALEERNCLLKNAQKGLPCDREELVAWSASLAEYASYLFVSRRDYIDRLSKYAPEFLSRMTDGKEKLSLFYKTDIFEENADELTRENVRDLYNSVFLQNIDREIAAGTTLYGPAREDIELTIGGEKARLYASQGQQRSVVLSLKQAEGEVCREICGEMPVYLYDDVLSELDDKRRAFLLNGDTEKQVIISSTDDRDIAAHADHVIEVVGGKFE